jgi:acetylornithine deacetylase
MTAVQDILARLVAFDTTSRHSNLALIEWVEGFLAERGVAARRVASPDGAKANLYAVIGPPVEGGVVLSGHTDVVPVDGQPWSSDPFVLTPREGRLYARGTADMKSFLALALAHVDAMLAARLTRPVILAFSYDEEVGCLGAPSMIAELARTAPAPAAVIVGEPTSWRVVSGHKGIRVFTVTVTGLEAHSSQRGQGLSAIHAALPLMRLVETMAAEAAARAAIDGPFDPPGATMTIGQVEGGTAANILARQCRFVWDLRCESDAEADHFEARFRAAAAEADTAIKRIAPDGGVQVARRSNTPPLQPHESAAERLARALTGDNGRRAAAYAAEGGLFQQAGMATVVCGPGDIAQAHQPDEWIALDQLAQGERFFSGLIARLSAP